ncbi:PLP-dependent aminotransferase family protein [Paenibacillus ehimensis]|uniref:MocR-like pyridoxine biosynthesis transcription factor PdxR n=1 Tax=Paenibacillus ehimensis TaxID=79264 RepID=UPI00046EF9EB|nr:PLP-dependent aminotransferase family protein [Paenibacillus ehimensis]
MRELSLELLPNQSPLFFQIYGYFKDGIRLGQLPYGSFLPSIRSCVRTLKVSKNTVETAYQLLVSEGYLRTIPKKGYQVVHQAETLVHDPGSASSDALNKDVQIDFRYGNIELSAFPFHPWNKARNTLIAHYQSKYEVEGHSQGEYLLRNELSRLLYESRGVVSGPGQIIIGSTPQQLLSLLSQLLDKNRNIIGVENPGYDGARNTLINHGFQVRAIPLAEDGISIEELEKSRANVVYVNPSQQFRNKLAMSQDKRQQLIQWVRSHAGADSVKYIIEDDYEWEFRYDDRYLPSIQSLAPEKIVYIGSISKTLLPVANLSYLVLPKAMLPLFRLKVREYDQPVSRLDQLTLAHYIAGGYWHKHLLKMRKHYEEKREALFEAISRYESYFVEVEGKDTGLHALLTVKTTKSESELLASALEKGVKVYGTSRYWLRPASEYPTILLGYGALSRDEIRAGIRRLTEAWFGPV